jgi:chemotaxis protein CheD
MLNSYGGDCSGSRGAAQQRDMEIEVTLGKVVVSKNGDCLTTAGVGSCLVVTLYDPESRIGAMGHAMLPSVPSHSAGRSTKYVDLAIDAMITRMEALGASTGNLEAKLVGGANMFPHDKEQDIGTANIAKAREKLKERNIRLVGESVGGSVGRSVEFSVASGGVTVKIKF